MLITRDMLVGIARETAQKRAMAEPDLVAAYLVGSCRGENPFLGEAADIDIVLVHAGQPAKRREILPLTPEISLDLIHNPRTAYDKPRELRLHPWLGPELYDPLPLFGTQHFFEFIQAGVRAEYHETGNILTRARRSVENARQIWLALQLSQETGPALLLPYLKGLKHAANAIALLTAFPLAERRFLLQFPALAAAAGAPGLADEILPLIGGGKADGEWVKGILPDWQKDFLEAASKAGVDARISPARLGYYKLAFESLLASETPLSTLWPLVRTWTACAAGLPPTQQAQWQSAMTSLGLLGEAFGNCLKGLGNFLAGVDAALEERASSQGEASG